MDDFKNQFRAAKAARSSAKLSKEQLRALKAQKAAATAEIELSRPSPEEDNKSMPPPPPRPSSMPPRRPQGQAATFHEDSQGTQVQQGGITGASLLHSEPSVNKNSSHAAQAPGDTNAANGTSAGASNLPTSFFETAGQGSSGGVLSSDGGGGIRHALSAEGSTGGVNGQEFDDARGTGFNTADLATSALSVKSWGDGGKSSQATPVGGFLPPEAGSAPEMSQGEGRTTGITGTTNAAGTGIMSGGSLPKGFFEGAAAQAEQTKHGLKKKPGKEMDQEFADFIKEVEVDAAAAAATMAQEGDDDEEARRHREQFEQFVRKERLRELKEQKSSKREREDKKEQHSEDPTASALELAGLTAEVAAPVIVLPKRRRVADTLAAMEHNNKGESESSDEEEDEGDADDQLLNWRAKKLV